MIPIIKKSIKINDNENLCLLVSHPDKLNQGYFSIDEYEYIKKQDKKNYYRPTGGTGVV